MKRITSLILLLCMGLLLWNCEEDDFTVKESSIVQDTHHHEPEIQTERLSWEEIFHKNEVEFYINRIEENIPVQDLYVSQSTGYDANPMMGLQINTSQVEYSTYEGGHSYTLPTSRETDNGLIENVLLITNMNGGYVSF